MFQKKYIYISKSGNNYCWRTNEQRNETKGRLTDQLTNKNIKKMKPSNVLTVVSNRVSRFWHRLRNAFKPRSDVFSWYNNACCCSLLRCDDTSHLLNRLISTLTFSSCSWSSRYLAPGSPNSSKSTVSFSLSSEVCCFIVNGKNQLCY